MLLRFVQMILVMEIFKVTEMHALTYHVFGLGALDPDSYRGKEHHPSLPAGCTQVKKGFN